MVKHTGGILSESRNNLTLYQRCRGGEGGARIEQVRLPEASLSNQDLAVLNFFFLTLALLQHAITHMALTSSSSNSFEYLCISCQGVSSSETGTVSSEYISCGPCIQYSLNIYRITQTAPILSGLQPLLQKGQAASPTPANQMPGTIIILIKPHAVISVLYQINNPGFKVLQNKALRSDSPPLVIPKVNRVIPYNQSSKG